MPARKPSSAMRSTTIVGVDGQAQGELAQHGSGREGLDPGHAPEGPSRQ